MIAYLPLWIIGIPLVLGLVDLMMTRPGSHDLEHDSTAGRYTGLRNELRRGEVPTQAQSGTTYRDSNAPANVS